MVKKITKYSLQVLPDHFGKIWCLKMNFEENVLFLSIFSVNNPMSKLTFDTKFWGCQKSKVKWNVAQCEQAISDYPPLKILTELGDTFST